MSGEADIFSDADVTAFLDGEADEALDQRVRRAVQHDADLARSLETLDVPLRAVRQAFDLDVLNAPSMPSHISEVPKPPKRRIALPLGLAASFALGMVFATALRSPPDWIAQVASYQALYATETLEGPGQAKQDAQAAITGARKTLGFAFTAAPEMPSMIFKRAQMLAIDGQPLIQLAYLDGNGVPFALCLTRVSEADRRVTTETAHDLAAASWVRDGLGYVLIGGSDLARISNLAQGLSQSL